jgi:SAM-dependent methyltransferase
MSPTIQPAAASARQPNATRILDLGSGFDRCIVDALTVDKVADTKPDVIHDLDVYPWPFPDSYFEEVYCLDTIEHLRDIVRTMEEIHRIARGGARVHITTPHFSCSNSYTDPTHLHHLGLFSFDYFTGDNQWGFYSKSRFKKISVRLNFHNKAKNRLVRRLANKFPEFYEEHLTWICPAWYMSFELEVIK